jgi:transcriptional regulator NrdR family protein
MMAMYEGDMICPHCRHKGSDFEVKKEWAHGLHLVNRVSCPSCKGEFRFYWGNRKDGTHFEYTIPKLEHSH